jgi:response regulator RpfG family c-di-GMP phosphodiesterase
MNRYILMLEHDDDDRYITQQTFDENNTNVRIQFVTTSHELFDFLDECSRQTKSFPSLILLNYYSLPQNSIDVLKAIKANHNFKHIPVIVLSGTANVEIITDCYREGASSFIQKPVLSTETNRKISSFVNYWFETASLV